MRAPDGVSARLAAALICALLAIPAWGAVRHHHHHGVVQKIALRRFIPMAGSPTDPAKDAALIEDGATGKVLYARNADVERHPASLTKMMTLYLLFDALKHGQMTMETSMRVSAHAAAQGPTKLYLKPGQTITVDTAIRAIVIRSANDVAVVIAEALGGTESHFAQMMTEKGRELGMRDTNYHNASGLPDPLQITTASDLAILARHVAYDFPQYFPYFGITGFTYHGTYYPTHDNLIGHYDGADGIKTGYTGGSGFNLATSVVRGGVHVIGIVMGGRTAYRRDAEMVRLLNDTFTRIAANPVLVARANVPWHAAEAAPAPSVLPPLHDDAIAALVARSTPLAPADDEDAAESAHEPGEDMPIIHAETPPPAPLVQPKIATAIPSIRPRMRPLIAVAAPISAAMPVASVSPAIATRLSLVVPQARPGIRTAPPVETGEGDIGDPGVPLASMPPRNWTIQIGAYADRNLAQTELANYAERSMDVLGQAARIVVPFQSVDGHTLFRARFGLFAEREARDVCGRLTQRGQTCFAALSTR